MNIVVRGTNWIGDAVMSVPALRRLRASFPEARITLHTRSWAVGVFEDSNIFDEILAFDTSRNAAVTAVEQANRLRPFRFDLGVIFPNSFASAFTMRLAGVKRRFGYVSDGRGFLLTDPLTIPEWKNQRHEAYYYLDLVAEIEHELLGKGERSDEPDGSLVVSNERRAAARELLTTVSVDPSRPLIAIGAGSTNSVAKRWGVENYAALADRLASDFGVNVILVGAENERKVSEDVAALAKHKVIDLAGRTTLAEAAAVLAEADLLIANDMGLAHLAPAVGTDTLVIFGPTNHVTTRPFSPHAEIIRAGVECSPCMLRECPIDHRCMTWVSVDAVFQKASEILLRTNDRKSN